MTGNAITDGNAILTSSTGCVVVFDLVSRLIDELKNAQMYNPSPLRDSGIIEPTTVEAVCALPQSADPPDMAIAQQGNIVFVYVNTDYFTLEEETRIIFRFTQNTTAFLSTSSILPAQAENRSLVVALAKEILAKNKGGRVSFEITEAVRSEKARLGLE